MLLRSLSSRKLTEWGVWEDLEAEDEHERQMEQEASARAGRPKGAR